MKRSWITALTLATVAGSGAAFAGVIANSNETPAAAQAPAAFAPAAFVRTQPQAPGAQTVVYQVGAAGTASLSIHNSSLVIDNALPGSGWGITSASVPGTHVEVQFTDGTQLVTFAAELVGNDIAVGVSNAPVASPVNAAEPAPTTVGTVQKTQSTPTPVTTAQPLPAVPAPTTAPAAAPPVSVSATTAPAAGDDGDHGDDDHEGESNDD